jgi:hypothetical protein
MLIFSCTTDLVSSSKTSTIGRGGKKVHEGTSSNMKREEAKCTRKFEIAYTIAKQLQ